MPYDDTAFPTGVVIFFRHIAADGSLARSVLPSGRNVVLGSSRTHDAHNDDYTVIDAAGKMLGCFPRDYVAAILPLETVGPGTDANNPPPQARN